MALQPTKIWVGNFRLAVPKSEVRAALVGLGCEGILPAEDACVVRNTNANRVSFGFIEFGYAEHASIVTRNP